MKSGIVRLIRQICVFREQGDMIAAGRLRENDLAGAVDEFRRRHGAEALPDQDLLDLFAAEERRVADAVILSELLLPRLLAALSAARTDAVTRPVARSLPSDARPAAIPAGPPAISDLLDAMLAAERSGRLSAVAPHQP